MEVRKFIRLSTCSAWILTLAFCLCVRTLAASDYLSQVKPLLEHKCYACHGVLKQQSGLRLDTGAAIRAGSDSGSVIDLESPNESLLLAAVTGESGLQMPPENEGSKLTAEEIEVLRSWIAAGAIVPEQEEPQTDPRAWWSYRPIESPPLPEVMDAAWCRNSIDRFVASVRDAHGLTPLIEASKSIWLRRVYLDLIGLPPTRSEQQRFLADDSPAAYENVVEKLLASPQYGERWGRHWMDIWRYSDWYGSRGINEIRYSQRHIWRWRDWIVNSLNDDRGYDAMIRAMLAADELVESDTDEDLDSLAATGYLGRNWYKFDRDVWMFDTVERTSEALLGLTLRCCRCHDHKFDPISQVDYYSFRAFFEPHDVRIDPVSMTTATEKDSTLGAVLSDGVSLVYDKNLAVPTYRYERGDSRFPVKAEPLTPGVPASLAGPELFIAPVELPVEVWYPVLRPELRMSLLAKAAAANSDNEQKLEQAKLQLAGAIAMLASAVDCSRAEEIESLKIKRSAAEQNLWLAEAELEISLAEQRSTQTRLAAEVAKHVEHNAASEVEITAQATTSERVAKILRAQVAIAKAILTEPAAATILSGDSVIEPAKTSPVKKFPAKKFIAQLSELVSLAGTLTLAEDKQKTLGELLKQLAAVQSEQTSAKANFSPLGNQYPKTSSGRRRALADWISSKENLRTARVAVNHLWGRHFGQPLVATPENFGLNGRQPTHPQLLDWLASRLMADDWQLKPLHRIIVLSNTYRMASAADALGTSHPGLTADSTNQYLWRMNSRRMEAEVVRDSTLHLASQLDTTFGGAELPETSGEKILRRSLYFRNTPNEKMSVLEVFDVADPNACYRRKESVVPHQSLALMNSGLTLDHSKIIAAQLSDEATSVENNQFIFAAFETILARPPSTQELLRCLLFLTEHVVETDSVDAEKFSKGGTAQRKAAEQPTARARENLVHVLLLHNDFVTVR